METTSIRWSKQQLSVEARELIMDITVYLFIVLFMYTSASKLFTIKAFASTLAKSPLIGDLNFALAWMIPVIEIIISILLIIPSLRKTGLRASLFLMAAFTIYLVYMVFSGNKLPCHCGGVINALTWPQHIWFNISFIVLAIIGLKINKQY